MVKTGFPFGRKSEDYFKKGGFYFPTKGAKGGCEWVEQL